MRCDANGLFKFGLQPSPAVYPSQSSTRSSARTAHSPLTSRFRWPLKPLPPHTHSPQPALPQRLAAHRVRRVRPQRPDGRPLPGADLPHAGGVPPLRPSPPRRPPPQRFSGPPGLRHLRRPPDNALQEGRRPRAGVSRGGFGRGRSHVDEGLAGGQPRLRLTPWRSCCCSHVPSWHFNDPIHGPCRPLPPPPWVTGSWSLHVKG